MKTYLYSSMSFVNVERHLLEWVLVWPLTLVGPHGSVTPLLHRLWPRLRPSCISTGCCNDPWKVSYLWWQAEPLICAHVEVVGGVGAASLTLLVMRSQSYLSWGFQSVPNGSITPRRGWRWRMCKILTWGFMAEAVCLSTCLLAVSVCFPSSLRLFTISGRRVSRCNRLVSCDTLSDSDTREQTQEHQQTRCCQITEAKPADNFEVWKMITANCENIYQVEGLLFSQRCDLSEVHCLVILRNEKLLLRILTSFLKILNVCMNFTVWHFFYFSTKFWQKSGRMFFANVASRQTLNHNIVKIQVISFACSCSSSVWFLAGLFSGSCRTLPVKSHDHLGLTGTLQLSVGQQSRQK